MSPSSRHARISLGYLQHLTTNRALLTPAPLLHIPDCHHYLGNHITSLFFLPGVLCTQQNRLGSCWQEKEYL